MKKVMLYISLFCVFAAAHSASELRPTQTIHRMGG